MMTSVRYAVSWVLGHSRRTLYHSNLQPCVDAAVGLSALPSYQDVEVTNCDTGEAVDFMALAND